MTLFSVGARVVRKSVVHARTWNALMAERALANLQGNLDGLTILDVPNPGVVIVHDVASGAPS